MIGPAGPAKRYFEQKAPVVASEAWDVEYKQKLMDRALEMPD
jgi:hypothetical protein